MATDTLHVKHGWVWAFAILIFFFNTFLLPEGLSYALLLTPVWLYMLYLQGSKRWGIILAILIPLVLYTIIHLVHGVDVLHYFRSMLMITGLIVFLSISYSCINNTTINWDLIFRDIAILNALFTLISFCLLPFPSINSIVWYKIPVTQDIEVPRLKLFTEEASHYSYLFAPIAIYFYSRMMFFKTSKSFFTLLIVTIPLLASFSLGVLSSIAFGCVIVFVVYFNSIFFSKRRQMWFVGSVVSIVAVLFAVYEFDPGNILFIRINNIFTGADTSARGRTYEAFILAHKIISRKSFLWGIGPGQLKLIGRDIIIQYYYYYKIPQVIRIPNACAETIVYFGYIGFCLRLLIEIILFFITKVYRNPYRLWIFTFAFIYQFTGSYITNAAEYLVWIVAFSSLFPEYEKLVLNPLKTLNP